ncbi:hypothetical protein ACLETS_24555, partial [Enterobacter ludwigii]
VAADVTSIASGATEGVNPEASAALGWVSMATGIAGMAAGVSLVSVRFKAFKDVTAHGDSVNIELNAKLALSLHEPMKKAGKDIANYAIPRSHLLPSDHVNRLRNIQINKMLNTSRQQMLNENLTPIIKKVRFNDEVREFLFKSTETRTPEKALSILDKAYRVEMDTMAKQRGLPFAFGHDSFEDGPKYYNHHLAVSEFSKLEVIDIT